MSSKNFFGRHPLCLAVAAAIAVAGFTASPSAQAYSWEKGEWSGSIDTTLTYGASWRVEDPSDNLIGKAEFNPLIFAAPNAAQRAARGGFSVNGDDGNQRFESGDLVSNAFKFLTEFSVNYRDSGAFARLTGFYDDVYDGDSELNSDARRKVGSRIQLLDAFLFTSVQIAGRDANFRLGKQVISWGESTFIQGGINTINPIDVSRVRTAGAEIKEAFLPVDMLWGSIGLTDNLSVEALVMFEWEQTEPEPAKTFFSTNDFATLGGEFVMLNFGLVPSPANFAQCAQTLATAPPTSVERVACSAAVPRGRDRNARDSGQHGIAFRYYAENLNSSELGLFYLKYHSRLPLLSGISVRDSNANSASYFAEFPEDIELYGLSINTTLPWGISLGAETSYRPNTPLQVDDVELLFSALSPLNALIQQPGNRFISQLGTLGPNQYVRGWERHKVSQWQATFTKLFGSEFRIGADQVATVLEVGATKVWDLPDPSVLRYQGDGTNTGGGPDVLSGALRNPQTQVDGFPTSFSWGYRLLMRADYNSVIGSINLSPRIAFNHDVNGISPGPGGQFLEDRKSYTLGLEGSYLNRWGADLSYTRFFGAGDLNIINDRDFMSLIVRYQF